MRYALFSESVYSENAKKTKNVQFYVNKILNARIPLFDLKNVVSPMTAKRGLQRLRLELISVLNTR